MKKKALAQAVAEIFQTSPKEIFNYKRVCKIIGIENETQKLTVVEILGSMVNDDFITETDSGRYQLNTLGTQATGIFRRRNNGKNSFIPEEGGAPVFVAERNYRHAMDGDKVKVQFLAKRKGATGGEAVVMEILERIDRTFVGRLQVSK